jgi:hypothetical protein
LHWVTYLGDREQAVAISVLLILVLLQRPRKDVAKMERRSRSISTGSQNCTQISRWYVSRKQTIRVRVRPGFRVWSPRLFHWCTLVAIITLVSDNIHLKSEKFAITCSTAAPILQLSKSKQNHVLFLQSDSWRSLLLLFARDLVPPSFQEYLCRRMWKQCVACGWMGWGL